MMIKFARFNIYLWVAAAVVLVCSSCKTHEEKKKEKEETLIELHQEVNPDGANDNETVSIFRQQPISVNVDKTAFLDTPDVLDAKVLNDMGGFVIQLKFNWRGTELLNAITTANRNKRIAIFCMYEKEKRWIACPVIHRPIQDGTITFTPDASREEADRIVKGLKKVTDELKKKEKF